MEQRRTQQEMPPMIRGVSVFGLSTPIRSARLADHIIRDLDSGTLPGTRFSPGTVVFDEGAAPAGAWVVSEGTARLLIRKTSGWPARSILISSGDAVGLTETLADLPYAAKFEAISPCRLLAIQREQLFDLLNEDAELRSELIDLLSREARSAYSRIVKYCGCDTYHRRNIEPDLCF